MSKERDLGFESEFIPEVKGYRQDYPGPDLEGFTRQTAQNALTIWEEINIRRADVGQDITTKDYSYFAQKVGKLGSNVIHLAATWSASEDPEQKQHGAIILWSQAIDPILEGLGKLKEAHPEVNFDEEDLTQEGIINSLKLFQKMETKTQVSGVLERVRRNTFSAGRRITREQTQEYSSVSDEELEQGEFVTAKLGSVVDPEEGAARTNLRSIIQETLATLPSRHERIIRRRWLYEGPQPAIFEALGIEEKVKGERIRQIEAKAIRLLRHPSRANKYVDFMGSSTVSIQFKNDEAKEQEALRPYWNGVINAVYLRDEARAKDIIARLRISRAFGAAGYQNLGAGYFFDQILKMEKMAGMQRREPITIPERKPEQPKAAETRQKAPERPPVADQPRREAPKQEPRPEPAQQPRQESQRPPRVETPPEPVVETYQPGRIAEVLNRVAALVGLKPILNGFSKDGGVGVSLLSNMRGCVLRVYRDKDQYLTVEFERLGKVDFNKPTFADEDHGIYRYAQINQTVRITSQRDYYKIDNFRETVYHERP